MNAQFLKMLLVCLLVQACALKAAWSLDAPVAATAYPKMFPLDQYLMPDKNSEAALARSAAPASIAQDADVLVLGKRGYERVVQGKNGFVCLVLRSWAAPADDPDFWNPKIRGPICVNAAAAHSYLPLMLKRTEWILGGKSKTEMVAALTTALDARQIPPPEEGAMSFMMSKQGYLNDRDGHWHPHLMMFVPLTAPSSWGADLPGSPLFASEDKENRITVFLIPVKRWSDGTVAETMPEH